MIAIAAVLASYVQPLSAYLGQRKAAQRDRAELNDLKRQNRKLKLSVREQNDPLTVEQEARRLGMVREGERPYIVDGLK